MNFTLRPIGRGVFGGSGAWCADRQRERRTFTQVTPQRAGPPVGGRERAGMTRGARGALGFGGHSFSLAGVCHGGCLVERGWPACALEH